MNDKRPIIIIKKKSSHAGHHGGAWKVAYADFVTAMMALFIVLWLTSSSVKIKKSIAGYFNDPSGSTDAMGTDKDGEGVNLPLDKKDISRLKDRLQQKIAAQPDLKKLERQIDIIITPEGMRIELIESKDGTFFETGSAVLNKTGQELLGLLAKELGDVPNRVSLEGHTDGQQYSGKNKYDNWDLSTDRANSARRLMQTTGLQRGQLAQVRGFADQQPRVPGDLMDPSNRRISVIVHYIGFSMAVPTEKAAGKAGDATSAGKGEAGKAAAGKPDAGKVDAATAAAAKDVPGKDVSAKDVSAKDVSAKDASGKTAVAARPGLLHSIPTAHDATAWVGKMTSSLLHHKATAVDTAVKTSAAAATPAKPAATVDK